MEEILEKVGDTAHGDVPAHHKELSLRVNLVVILTWILDHDLIVIMFALDISANIPHSS